MPWLHHALRAPPSGKYLDHRFADFGRPLGPRKQASEECLCLIQPILGELPVSVIAVAWSDYRSVTFKFGPVALDQLANSARAGKAETLGQGHIEDTRLAVDRI